jgi:hypothetical protein
MATVYRAEDRRHGRHRHRYHALLAEMKTKYEAFDA